MFSFVRDFLGSVEQDLCSEDALHRIYAQANGNQLYEAIGNNHERDPMGTTSRPRSPRSAYVRDDSGDVEGLYVKH